MIPETMISKKKVGMFYPPGGEDWQEFAKVVKDDVAKHSLLGDLNIIANEIFEKVMNLIYGPPDGLSDCDSVSDSHHDL